MARPERSLVTRQDIVEGIVRLDLCNRPVCLHVSLRSFGQVDGGASSVVDAFLSQGCTLLVPSFTEETSSVAPPPDDRLVWNGLDASYRRGLPHKPLPFDPKTRTIDKSMGAIPRAVVNRPDHLAGVHPLDSFAALGPRAPDLVGVHDADAVYAPLEALVNLDGQVLLIGVGLNRMTLLHLAEQRAGRRLFRRWALLPHGKVVSVETGGCSEGFPALDPCLHGIERRTTVGASLWRAFEAATLVEHAANAISSTPSITYCGDEGCTRCRDAIAGGPKCVPLS